MSEPTVFLDLPIPAPLWTRLHLQAKRRGLSDEGYAVMLLRTVVDNVERQQVAADAMQPPDPK